MLMFVKVNSQIRMLGFHQGVQHPSEGFQFPTISIIFPHPFLGQIATGLMIWKIDEYDECVELESVEDDWLVVYLPH